MERLAGCRAPHLDAALGLIFTERRAARIADNFPYRFYATLTRTCFKSRRGRATPARGTGHDPVSNSRIDKLVQALTVLVVDDNQYMRKVVRNILVNLGVKNIHEAPDGIAGLEAIRMFAPDLVILDWEMPLLNGPELVRIVRSPGVFPLPDIPIIMLTSHGERKRIVEAVRIGVNEFLCKPVSAKALTDRFISILAKPRASVHVGEYYGPEPRKTLVGQEPSEESGEPVTP